VCVRAFRILVCASSVLTRASVVPCVIFARAFSFVGETGDHGHRRADCGSGARQRDVQLKQGG
jgi:hypothetical protein